jgi:prepilin-type N-terminal cleavage/methylation domain-containing protein
MSRRFTLVELMIVIAIIGILAAIAVPELNEAQLKAKRSELPLNLDGITVAYLAYDAAHDRFYAQGSAIPVGALGKKTRPWVTTTFYTTLGFRPDGAVRGNYYSPLFAPNGVDTVGQCDVDDDGVLTYFLARIDNGALIDRDWMVSGTDTF